MSTYKIFAVTNRKLCSRPFLEQIERVAITKPDAIILREKDLSEAEYEKLAKKVIEICRKYQVSCILHTYAQAAIRLGCRKIHLPLSIFIEKAEHLNFFEEVGVSIHSLEEAILSEKYGATYITAGHIFVTDCKRGVQPKGVSFLKEICETVHLPVYAIGGINKENVRQTIEAGTKGACIMSGFMKMETLEKH